MYLVKTSQAPGFTAIAKNLAEANAYVNEEKNPERYSIWRFVGSNKNDPTHFTCIKMEGWPYENRLWLYVLRRFGIRGDIPGRLFSFLSPIPICARLGKGRWISLRQNVRNI